MPLRWVSNYGLRMAISRGAKGLDHYKWMAGEFNRRGKCKKQVFNSVTTTMTLNLINRTQISL